MNSIRPPGTLRIADKRRGNYSKAAASILGKGGHERRGLRAAKAMPILPLLLLLILPTLAQARFEYSVGGGMVTITRYTGPGGDVAIPDTIAGLPVTSIGDSAFSDCTGLTWSPSSGSFRTLQ